MRKRSLFLCACALMLCLGGCGKEEKNADAKDEETKTETESGKDSKDDSEKDTDDGNYSPIVAKNTKGVDKDAEYPYEIRVNTKENCITVFGVDDTGKYIIPVRAMLCASGEEAPNGTFQLGDSSCWQMDADGMFSQYATRIVDDVVFRSASYYSQNNNDLNVEQFNQMGQEISGSSIQLEVADAKWISKNCPEGTKVEIADGGEASPLGKPRARRLKEDETKDPTDTGKSTKKPEEYVPIKFEGIEDKLVGTSKNCNLLAGVTAYDSEDNDLTAQIQVYGEIDFTTPGVYEVSYMCRNEDKESRVAVCSVEVTDDALAPEPEPTAAPTPEPQASTSEPTPEPTPQPTAAPAPVPTAAPTPMPTPQATAAPTPAPTTVPLYVNDTTPPVIRLVANTRYVYDVSYDTLASRVRVIENTGMLEDLYISVQQWQRSNVYVVVYEAVDYAGNSACLSETVEVRNTNVVFR